MGWRFRRSKVFGPLRLTSTKSGLSLSAGGPFGRVSVNTRGQVRETTRIPGVGLYQTRRSGRSVVGRTPEVRRNRLGSGARCR